MLSFQDIARVHLGHCTAPSDHPLAGRTIVVEAYAVRHPRGLVLFDSGFADDPEIGAHFRIVRRSLSDGLASLGASIDQVYAVVNCHLHFDHAGENFRFPGTPIFAQRAELEAARTPDYTLAAPTFDFPGARFELLDGEAKPFPGLTIIPTPGHVPGHQSLLVDAREGRVLLAGQAFETASDYALAEYVGRLVPRDGSEDVRGSEWIRKIQELDPAKVVFAHDLASWDRDLFLSR